MIKVTGRKIEEKKENFLKKSVAEEKKNANLNGTFEPILGGQANSQAMEKWFSTKEAALHLGLSPNALRILVHRGKVKAYKLGARLKFRIKDLESNITLKKEAL